MLAAVLDPNVLVAAAIAPRGICGQVLNAAIDRSYSILVSPTLLLELAEVLARPKFRRYLTEEEAQRFVALVGDLAILCPDDPSRTDLTHDPDDDYLVALAQSTLADYLVSGDQDLLHLGSLEPSVLTPRAFLDLLAATPFGP